MSSTVLRKLHVNQFRGLENIEIPLGSDLTVICGKNGTAKSTILGLIAQIFSFDTNYATGKKLEFIDANGTASDYRTITGKSFTSRFSEHFRFSKKFDLPGSLDCTYSLYDALLNQEIDTLSLNMTNTAGRDFRTVVRGNATTPFTLNTSRNVTHPIIYLSLKRLIPLAERLKYDSKTIDYLNNNHQEFINLSNKILGKRTSNSFTATSGTLESAVAHSDKYDHESVSVGEDNCGQIVLALLSFKKLSEEIGEDYKGGILLIDEIDAGLFPAAQKNLISVLMTYASKLKLQIVMTSHSPLIIEEVKKKSEFKKQNSKYKVLYLSNAFGKTQVCQDYSWEQILADLKIETLTETSKHKLPPVNVYFEDKEASDFFSSLIISRKFGFLNKFDEITNGCSFYISLMDKKIPEFCTKSIVVFDADVNNINKYKNVLKLPSTLPPDQLIFDFLFRLPADDKFWFNKIQYTKEVFLHDTSDILERLSLNDAPDADYNLINLLEIDRKNGNKKIRDLFKDFYQSDNLQRMLKKVDTNPFRYYLSENQGVREAFTKDLISKLTFVLTEGYQIDLAYVKVVLSSE